MPNAPIHAIVELPGFTGQVARLRMSARELAGIYDTYAIDPGYGAIIRNTGGLRKGRIAKDATGKSGGYRVFSFFADDSRPVFLLWVIDKSEDATLSDVQEQTFKRLTTRLKQELLR